MQRLIQRTVFTVRRSHAQRRGVNDAFKHWSAACGLCKLHDLNMVIQCCGAIILVLRSAAVVVVCGKSVVECMTEKVPLT